MGIKLTLAALLLGAMFALGRFTPPSAATIVDKIVEKDKTVTTIVVNRPDGTVKTVTKTKVATKSGTKTVVEPAIKQQNKTRVFGIIAYDWDNRQSRIYGAFVTRQVIGSLEVGAFALTNGTFGGVIGWGF